MSIGDHISVCHGVYTHHGIDLGDGRVVHYGRGLQDIENAKVEIVSMEKFSGGKEVNVVKSVKAFSSEQIAWRAMSRIGERCYDLFDNNCEHFVNWCRSGRAISTQVAITKTILRQAAAVGSRALLRKGLRGAVARRTVRAPLIVADLIQAGVELIALNNGKDEEESETLGAKAGAASSLGIGFLTGGPTGAASGIGLWAAGQIFGRAAINAGEQVLKENLPSDKDPDPDTIEGSVKS